MKKRLRNTLIKYFEKFGNFKYEKVWGIQNTTVKSNIFDSNPNNSNPGKQFEFELPNYQNNIMTEPDLIKIFIFYTFDDGYYRPKECEGTQYGFKKWKPNPNKFDIKILTIKIDKFTSINMLKKYISNKTSHPEVSIILYEHPTYKKILNQKKIEFNKSKNKYNFSTPSGTETFASNYLGIMSEKKLPDDESILAKSSGNFIFYICELVELSQNGFC